MMTEDLIYTGKTWRGLNKLETPPQEENNITTREVFVIRIG
jgi:hypothetical protein